jgi:hypothetical protein
LHVKRVSAQFPFRASIEKYRLKASASVALGIDAADTTKPFDFAFSVEGPWEADQVLDEALEKERPKAMPGHKLPGRNERCICGERKAVQEVLPRKDQRPDRLTCGNT